MALGAACAAPDSERANAEELLAELVRLVEFTALTPECSRPPAESLSEPTRADTRPMQLLAMASLRPSVEVPSSKPSETGAIDVEQLRAGESDNSYPNDPNGTDLAAGRHAGAWKFEVSALVLVGAAMVGSIFWLKRVEPEPSNGLPSIATMPPRGNLTVATSSEAGVPGRDIQGPAQGKVTGHEDQQIDANARVSLNSPPQSNLAPKPIGAAQPIADMSTTPPAASVNTSAVATPIAAPQPMAPQSLDPKPVPAVSPPPGSTQIAIPTPSGVADAPLPPLRPAPKPAVAAAGVAQRSTSKLDLLTKLSSRSEARVAVAMADATGAKAIAERSGPSRREASIKPENGAKMVNAAQAQTEAQAALSEQPVAASQQNPNPVVHAFRNMVGALAGLIPFIPH